MSEKHEPKILNGTKIGEPRVFDATKIGKTEVRYMQPKKLDPNGEVQFLAWIYRQLTEDIESNQWCTEIDNDIYDGIIDSIRNHIIEIQKLLTPPEHVDEIVQKILGEK